MYNGFGDKMQSCNSCKECKIEKYRTETEKKELIKRLNTIEGQIRGIKQMIADNRYCNDIVIQLSAINNGLKSLGNCLLQNHMKTCMVDEIKKNNLDIVDDIMNLMKHIN